MAAREVRSPVRCRTRVRVSNRDVQERRSGSLASGSGLRRHLQGYSGIARWGYSRKPDLFRLYVGLAATSEHAVRSACFRPPSLGEMVPAIGGSHLDGGLASSFPDHSADKSGDRTHVRQARRASADEFLRHWTVDVISAVRADYASNHCKLRNDDGLSLVQAVV